MSCPAHLLRYLPSDVIRQREGDGPAGDLAARNYVAKAVDLFKQGVKQNGHSFVVFNSWTRRPEYLGCHSNLQ
eukprot:7650447-Alexandrium_andersonii.AAC.1